MNLLDALSGIGTVLDTPGAMLRTGLAGENPFAAVFDTDKRVSGRDLLERYGLAGKNEDQGWIPDMGDLGGFAAEMLLDPTNLIGGLGLAKRMMGISKAKTANRGIDAVVEGNRGAQKTNLAQEMASGLRSESDDLGQMRKYQSHTNDPPHYIDEATGEKIYVHSDMPWEHSVNVRYIPDSAETMFQQWPNQPTHQDKLDYLYGTRDQAAATIAKGQGLQIQEANPIAKKLAEGGEFNAYGFHAPFQIKNTPIAEQVVKHDYITPGLFDDVVTGGVRPMSPLEELAVSGKIDKDEFLRLGNESRYLTLPKGVNRIPDQVEQVGGFITHNRPDVQFTSGTRTEFQVPGYNMVKHVENSLPLRTNIASHEAVHSLARHYPEEFAKFQEALGPGVRGEAMKRRFGEEGALWYALSHMAGHPEEAAATAIGDSLQHAASRQSFPTIDAMFVNSPRELSADPGLAQELAVRLKKHYPYSKQGIPISTLSDLNEPFTAAKPEQFQEAAQILLDYLQGNYKKRNALVPSGKVVDESFPRSFFQGELPVEPRRPMEAGPASMMAVPERRRVASMVPLLTALLGHNAMARPKYGGGAE